jgi:hypothetical protein
MLLVRRLLLRCGQGATFVTNRTLRHLAFCALSTTIIGFGALATPAQDVVEIRMRGRYYSEPATVRITVAVEPDQSNRALRVEADGDRLFRSTEIPLEGSKEQRIHVVEFKNLPAGSYSVRASVMSNANVCGSAEELVVVGEPGGQQ